MRLQIAIYGQVIFCFSLLDEKLFKNLEIIEEVIGEVHLSIDTELHQFSRR